ncbi:hypothetical protein M3B44_11740 [Klebsiella quasipneumoniae]|uniref:hypothetical protein n=1 Tax=Klebsiella quasipneumoniae TaxID=1463165 RepID=UPI002ABB84A8|nr:hypothetical protein [Klebsiella quasipneumoniae]MDZ3227269.1 hypothetical protein [Klebsiella quasipneumoniae]MDZ3231127.1 hypothetical protein [Klebsiella quasipneumoniae]
MLYSAISFAKKDLFIDKKMQWKMSQNSEQLAGNGGKDVFCDFDAVLGRETADGARRAALARAYGIWSEPSGFSSSLAAEAKKACSLSRLFEFGR